VRARPVHQVLQHHSPAHAPAEQVHRIQVERVDDGGQVIGVVAHPAGRVHRLGIGVTEATQVDRQRPVRRRQGQHGRLPEQRGRHVAVHEQHRVTTVAAGHRQHVYLQATGREPFGGDAG
jgi:hypothetical protein